MVFVPQLHVLFSGRFYVPRSTVPMGPALVLRSRVGKSPSLLKEGEGRGCWLVTVGL